MRLNFAVDLDQDQARRLTNKDIEDVKQLIQEVIVTALSVRPQRREVVRGQLVELLVGEVALTRVDIKRARLEAKAVRAIRHSTEWLTSAEIADLAELGPADPIGTVSRWKQQGRIYALRHGGKDFYPKYALGPDFHPLPVIKEILAVLSGYDPSCWQDGSTAPPASLAEGVRASSWPPSRRRCLQPHSTRSRCRSTTVDLVQPWPRTIQAEALHQTEEHRPVERDL